MVSSPAAVLAVAMLAACAGVRPASPAAPAPLPLHTLSGREISQSDVLTAYDAVQRLRPQFLLWTRGSGLGTAPFAIYIDEHRALSADELRAIPAQSVREMTLLDGAEATLRYGSGHSGGALVVLTGAPGD